MKTFARPTSQRVAISVQGDGKLSPPLPVASPPMKYRPEGEQEPLATPAVMASNLQQLCALLPRISRKISQVRNEPFSTVL